MKTKPPTPDPINERRDYFRVADKVHLRHIRIDEGSALANHIPAEFRDDLGYSLVRELQRIDREHSPQLRAIADGNRDLEIYLKAINRKIELIASRLAEQHGDLDQKEQQTVSLSEGGISFSSRKELAQHTHLALQLTLLPSHITLVLFGQVISCSTADRGDAEGFNVAVSFINLKEEDRQTLAKHIMQLQLAQRRQQHEQ